MLSKVSISTTNQKKRISLSIATTELIVSLFVLIGVIVGLFEFYNSSLSLEFLIVSIVTFMSSFGPVLALSNLPGNLSQTFASANRIFDLLEEEPTLKEIKTFLLDVIFQFQVMLGYYYFNICYFKRKY